MKQSTCFYTHEKTRWHDFPHSITNKYTKNCMCAHEPYCMIFHTCLSESGWSGGYLHTNMFCSCVINTLVLLALLMAWFLKGKRFRLDPFSLVFHFNQPERKRRLSVCPLATVWFMTLGRLWYGLCPMFSFFFVFLHFNWGNSWERKVIRIPPARAFLRVHSILIC